MLGKQMFALPFRGVTQIKFISVTNPYSGKHPQSRFFCVIKGGAEVFCEPTGSQVPLAQNNPYAKVAHLGGGGLPQTPSLDTKCKHKCNRRVLNGSLKSHLQMHFLTLQSETPYDFSRDLSGAQHGLPRW